MALIIDGILSGILTGGVYALMASGLTLIFGVLGIVNIAQGIFVVLGAYLSYALNKNLHMDIFLSLLITIPAMFLLGLLIEWAFVRRLKQDHNRVMLSVLLMYAISLIIEGGLNRIFTVDQVVLQAPYTQTSIPIGGFYLPHIYLYAFGLSILLLFGLYLLIYRTQFGYSLRASMQNRTAAELIGINVKTIAMITFAIGVAVTAVGGMVYGALAPFNSSNGDALISRLLVIIVLGGMGSLRGAFVAAIIMLVVSDLTTVLWSQQWAVMIFFVLLVVLLVVRPQGLFGQTEGRMQ